MKKKNATRCKLALKGDACQPYACRYRATMVDRIPHIVTASRPAEVVLGIWWVLLCTPRMLMRAFSPTSLPIKSYTSHSIFILFIMFECNAMHPKDATSIILPILTISKFNNFGGREKVRRITVTKYSRMRWRAHWQASPSYLSPQHTLYIEKETKGRSLRSYTEFSIP